MKREDKMSDPVTVLSGTYSVKPGDWRLYTLLFQWAVRMKDDGLKV
jgi:hypothetical protein